MWCYAILSDIIMTTDGSSQSGCETFVAHYNDVIMGAIASQITSLTIVYSAIYSDAVQRKHQSSASLAFVWWIHRWPVNSPHKWPVTRKMFPFDDVIMQNWQSVVLAVSGFGSARVSHYTEFRIFSAQGKLLCTSKQKRLSFYRAYKYVSHTKVFLFMPETEHIPPIYLLRNQTMPGLVSIFRTNAQLLA